MYKRQGFECGGHPGEDDIPNMILLPRAAEELKIPFVASGGMANARSLVSALAFGAEGMNMGTRFIATKEAPVHDNVKQRLVEASELETRLVMRPLRNTERVLVNKAVDEIMEIEANHKDNNDPNALLEEIRPLVAGSERVLRDGDLEAAAWTFDAETRNRRPQAYRRRARARRRARGVAPYPGDVVPGTAMFAARLTP